jgi:hypothetical protein
MFGSSEFKSMIHDATMVSLELNLRSWFSFSHAPFYSDSEQNSGVITFKLSIIIP